MSVRVYTYGLLGPTENGDLVREQMRLAHRYRNDLIAVERGRRAAVRAVIAEAGDIAAIDAEIEAALRELDGVRAEIKAARSAERSRRATSPRVGRAQELRERLRELRASRKEVQAQIKGDEALQARIGEINERAKVLSKALRAKCGVYWGTYLLVEAAVDAARRGKMDPKFMRWDGHGRIGVQIQGGMPAVSVMDGDDTRIRIGRVDERAWTARSRGERRRLSRTTLQMRVGSDGRDPIWATFPMIMHRPLPVDGRIKCADVSVKRIGTRERWELHITVDAPSLAGPERQGDRRAAVHFGWRSRPDGVRVAYLVDSDDASEEIIVPPEIIARLEHADSLRSIRDREMNALKEALPKLMPEAVPDWMRAELRRIPLLRSPAKLTSIVYRWSRDRFDGDDEAFAAAEEWRRQDRHLFQWEMSEREKTRLRRRDLYRNIAARLAREYDEIVVDGTDFSPLARTPEPEDDRDKMSEAVQYNRAAASPGELRLAITQAAQKRGTRIVTPPKGLRFSATCSICGGRCSDVKPDAVTFLCERSGDAIDRDANAARNLLVFHDGTGTDEDLSRGAAE